MICPFVWTLGLVCLLQEVQQYCEGKYVYKFYLCSINHLFLKIPGTFWLFYSVCLTVQVRRGAKTRRDKLQWWRTKPVSWMAVETKTSLGASSAVSCKVYLYLNTHISVSQCNMHSTNKLLSVYWRSICFIQSSKSDELCNPSNIVWTGTIIQKNCSYKAIPAYKRIIYPNHQSFTFYTNYI